MNNGTPLGLCSACSTLTHSTVLTVRTETRLQNWNVGSARDCAAMWPVVVSAVPLGLEAACTASPCMFLRESLKVHQITRSRHPHSNGPCTAWVGILCVCKIIWFIIINRPPLWSSGQSSWLQIRRPGFDSRHYQEKKTVVGLERGPLSLVSTIEDLPDRKVAAPA
jgi:hypothetical protein